MSGALRFVALAAVVVCMIGCYSVPPPQDVIPDAFPASGPVGLRAGFAYQHNSHSKSLDKTQPPYEFMARKDATDMWPYNVGGFVEVPVDYNPFWGGFVGVGWDHLEGDKVAGRDVGSLELLPAYGGLTARLPFWLDWDAWAEIEDPVWLPNVPNGPAVYVRGLGGWAYTVGVPKIHSGKSGSPRTRAVDWQAVPFCEGSGGVEYRYKDFGVWAEIGYRYYFLEGGRDYFDVDGLGGVRVSAGISWYGF
ncbi:MAG TPA: hypothetical protein PKX48_02200 [Planctomycetota bacterium]|jgi:hypothetical protein|nr:hypothetical protein [Planctomycetota bacterium]OQC21551.1 MAG: hypothetical protein BWX69_00759 [Planctomycetes bacterium ADurb.Bin069]NMD35757.1 hypothetical protein [Planctomycetota bacterium]HNR98583.1 hypothetical protein [Planctomycetota bacterium]HNU26128.1 hypothetical protein [Planctomycetota bacterium]